MKDQDKIICSCANLSETKINKYFESKNNDVKSFDQFLNETKAGTFCTACRLDLETIFIQKNGSDVNFQKINFNKNLSFKRKIYNFVDSFFPKLTLQNQNYFPILHVNDIEFKQSVWITNMEIISDRLKPKIKIDDVGLTINLYNSLGSKVWTTKDIVNVNTRGIFDIPSEKILVNDEDISIGWIEVLRKFKLNCSKGTTRPQIMIYTENSSCAVHGQDIAHTQGYYYSSIFRPNTDIQILSFINPSKKQLDLVLEPPIQVDNNFQNSNSKLITFKIPPRGSMIHNINKDERFKNFDDKYFTLSWKGSGKYKSHIYCISKNFRYISLDHL